MYHEQMRAVHHAEDCPLSDPGCHAGLRTDAGRRPEEKRRADDRVLPRHADQPVPGTGLVAGLLASLACGVIGPYVVTRRIVFLSGAIAHMAVGGIGAALFLATMLPRRVRLAAAAPRRDCCRPWPRPCSSAWSTSAWPSGWTR